MKLILLSFIFLFCSCKSKLVKYKTTSPTANTQPASTEVESNSTILGIDTPSVNIFNPDHFSPFEVSLVLISIILTLCFSSFLPNIKKYINKKRS